MEIISPPSHYPWEMMEGHELVISDRVKNDLQCAWLNSLRKHADEHGLFQIPDQSIWVCTVSRHSLWANAVGCLYESDERLKFYSPHRDALLKFFGELEKFSRKLVNQETDLPFYGIITDFFKEVAGDVWDQLRAAERPMPEIYQYVHPDQDGILPGEKKQMEWKEQYPEAVPDEFLKLCLDLWQNNYGVEEVHEAYRQSQNPSPS